LHRASSNEGSQRMRMEAWVNDGTENSRQRVAALQEARQE